MKKLVLIDGHHFMFRAFYAFYQMLDEENPKNAIFGFASMLLTVLQYEQPDYLAFAFDKGKSFRHDEHEEYKGTRGECPEALKVQMPKIYEMVEKMGIPQYYIEGFEADDVLGAMAHAAIKESEDIQVSIVSSDKDLFQLVNDRVHIAVPINGGGLKHHGPKEVQQSLGVSPAQVPDYKGIAGDSADNIPGVMGIGPKTAVKLLYEYKTLEGIYENLEAIKGAVKTKLERDKDQAFHCKYLATIVTDMDFTFDLNAMNFNGLAPEVLDVFKQYQFPALERRVQNFLYGNLAPVNTQLSQDAEDIFRKEEKKEEQLSLF